MIVRTRDRKALEKQLKKEKERADEVGPEIELTRSRVEDLECQLSDLEDEQEALETSIKMNEDKLAAILGEKQPTPARSKVRPKAEVPLTAFNLVN